MVPAEKKAVVVLVNGGSGLGFGETAPLLNGITATALGLDYDGEGSRIWQKALFISLVALPVVYLLSMIWAWRHRAAIRAKSRSGISGRFSLWFPLLTTLVAAWAIFTLVPSSGGRADRHDTTVRPGLRFGAHRHRCDRGAVGGVQAWGGLHRTTSTCLMDASLMVALHAGGTDKQHRWARAGRRAGVGSRRSWELRPCDAP